jgi:hypothetical protein
MISREQFSITSNLLGYPFCTVEGGIASFAVVSGNRAGCATLDGTSRIEPVGCFPEDNDDEARSDREGYGAEVCQFIEDMTLREDDCA